MLLGWNAAFAGLGGSPQNCIVIIVIMLVVFLIAVVIVEIY